MLGVFVPFWFCLYALLIQSADTVLWEHSVKLIVVEARGLLCWFLFWLFVVYEGWVGSS